jgi:hypothetical protein
VTLRSGYGWAYVTNMNMKNPTVRTVLASLLWAGPGLASAVAGTWFVAPGGTGPGTTAAPFGTIQAGIDAARPGDVVHVAPGTYRESLRTVRAGSSSARITIRAPEGRGTVTVHGDGRVLTVGHPYVTVEGLILDGNYGSDDAVRVAGAATGFTLRHSEVRRTSRDGVDIGPAADVTIEDSLIHRALNAQGGRTDAHGIVAGAVRRLTIRRTEVHTFSGDAVQVDPGRADPGWNDVVIEDCKLWLMPLAAAENGFAAGTVPGENALDTKSSSALARARITVRNTEAWGYRNGLIGNMAAFNLKENIDATIDRVTVRDSEIAFRVRGPSATHPAGAWAAVRNAIVYGTGTAFRYEDDVQNLRIWNVTVGAGVARAFHAAEAAGATLDVRNLLVLGSTLPAQAGGHSSNLAVAASSFVDAGQHNYQLALGSPALDAGEAIPGVTADRQGTPRPQGARVDVGAFERMSSPKSGTAGEIVLYAGKAAVVVGSWEVRSHRSAADGLLIRNPDAGGETRTRAQASPDSYFELTFEAQAGVPYRIWIRGRAEGQLPSNDSVFVQFSQSLSAGGSAAYRIGSRSAAMVSLADCATCPLAGWGWQDNGEGVGVLGPLVYFASSGRQTVRVQPREDGLSIDQIVLSPSAYLTVAPGAPVRDTTILEESAL